MSIKSNAHPCWQGLSWTSAMSLRGVLSLFLCIHGYRPVAMQEENSNSTASEWLSWLISSFNHVYLLFLYLVIVFPSANTHVQWIILIREHCFNIFQRWGYILKSTFDFKEVAMTGMTLCLSVSRRMTERARRVTEWKEFI